MAFCIGGKACRRAKCKERCKSWFGAQPDILKACKNACKANSALTKEDFQCSGHYIDEAVIIGAYGYDPCPGGTTIKDYLNPNGEGEDPGKNSGILIAGAFLLLATLGAFFFLLKRRV